MKVTTYITKGVPFFLESPFLTTLPLSVLAGEQSWHGWPPGKFLKQCVSEDKAHRKDLWWFVWPVGNP